MRHIAYHISFLQSTFHIESRKLTKPVLKAEILYVFGGFQPGYLDDTTDASYKSDLATPVEEDEDPIEIYKVHLIQDSICQIDSQPMEESCSNHEKEDNDPEAQIQYLIKENERGDEENETAEPQADLMENYLAALAEIQGK
jgi:hypothetical protein